MRAAGEREEEEVRVLEEALLGVNDMFMGAEETAGETAEESAPAYVEEEMEQT